MVVVAPCDYHEAKRTTLAFAQYQGPAYMRLAREATPGHYNASLAVCYG